MVKKVLGVKIDDVSIEQALKIVSDWLTCKPANQLTSKLVFTPGPEFLVTADSDAEFKKILNNSDLNLPDGFGLRLGGVKNIIHGVDFMLALCDLARRKGWTIGLLGGASGIAVKTAEKLKKMYPNLKVKFSIDGQKATQYLIDVHTSLPCDVDILFVAFGHPKQERVLAKFKTQKSKFKIGMGVGGSFDFISGAVLEPPKIFSDLGLKWLGRLVTRPAYMLPKAYKALIRFPWFLWRAAI